MIVFAFLAGVVIGAALYKTWTLIDLDDTEPDGR